MKAEGKRKHREKSVGSDAHGPWDEEQQCGDGLHRADQEGVQSIWGRDGSVPCADDCFNALD